jgi:L-threonylcarbamoyladenylate synthase
MKTEILSIHDPRALAYALEILTGGGLVALPTDTVYGLGALVYEGGAVEEIFRVKGREIEKAIPIMIADVDQMERVSAGMNSTARKLAERFWPGPITLVVPRHPSIPDVVSPFPTVGVRIPQHDATRELLRMAGPMAVTSANISGQSAPSTARGVEAQLGGLIPLILDGGTTLGGMPSTVVDCTELEPKILRAGPITAEQIVVALAG